MASPETIDLWQAFGKLCWVFSFSLWELGHGHRDLLFYLAYLLLFIIALDAFSLAFFCLDLNEDLKVLFFCLAFWS
jgi:hypothetical protein